MSPEYFLLSFSPNETIVFWGHSMTVQKLLAHSCLFGFACIRHLQSPSTEPLGRTQHKAAHTLRSSTSARAYGLTPSTLLNPLLCFHWLVLFQRPDKNCSFIISLSGTHICSKNQVLVLLINSAHSEMGYVLMPKFQQFFQRLLKIQRSGKNPDQRSEAKEHQLHKTPAEVSKQAASSKQGVAVLKSEKELEKKW